MPLIDHLSQPLEEWRPGVMTRMLAAASNGAHQLCLFEQFCDPGCGAPTHLHAVEEVLTVLAGAAEIWVGEKRHTVAAGQSVLIPAGQKHGFRNTGETTLHVHATLASPIFEAGFDDPAGTRRRWAPG